MILRNRFIAEKNGIDGLKYWLLQQMEAARIEYSEQALNQNKMGIIKEPKNIDFTVQSQPWTEEELKDFRKLMGELKAKSIKGKVQPTRKK